MAENMSKFKGRYPLTWTKSFRDDFRSRKGNKCERCGHKHDPENGYALTIHHLDNDKSNCSEWNLAALCQRCHLQIQGKVNMFQEYALDHSEWFKPHIEGMRDAISKGEWP